MKKWILMAMAIVSLLIFVGCGQEAAVEVETEKVIGVVVETPNEGSLVNETSMVGKLVAKSSATAVAQLAVPEKILLVNYKVGDYVEKDDVIAFLDTESTDDQVENARLSYLTAVKNYNALLESVELSEANLARTQSLYDSGIASKQQLEAAELQASDGQLKTVANQMNQAKFAYENVQKSLDNTTVLAPISGIISVLNFEESNLATSQNMVVVTDLSEMKVILNITEEMLGKIDAKYKSNWDDRNSKFEKAKIGIVGNILIPSASNTTLISNNRIKWISTDSIQTNKSVKALYECIIKLTS